MKQPKWETLIIEEEELNQLLLVDTTETLLVPGGMIYRTVVGVGRNGMISEDLKLATSMVFVPVPDKIEIGIDPNHPFNRDFPGDDQC